MATPSDSTAQIIVRAALECLEQHGLGGMTVRKIAMHAKVNVAAINYHFGSKEKLLEQVFDLATTNAFGDLDQFVNAESAEGLEQQLYQFLLHYAGGLAQYPNVSKVMLHQIMSSPQGQNIVAQRLETFLEKLNQHIAKLYQSHPTDFAIRFKTMQIMSVFMCLGMIPNTFNHALAINTQDQKNREQLIKAFLQDLHPISL
ncbi:MAG: hypothetical protein RLZZ156_2240 [Deinococcota bacterium]|jgi:AcrR family transcriptional regulator